MTPKEQEAKELIELFTFNCRECDNAKQCATIAVNKILEIGWNLPHYKNINGVDYWNEVKQEILNYEP
jgi:hypothetical protein